MNATQKSQWQKRLVELQHTVTALKIEARVQKISWLTDGLAGLEGYVWGLKDAMHHLHAQGGPVEIHHREKPHRWRGAE